MFSNKSQTTIMMCMMNWTYRCHKRYVCARMVTVFGTFECGDAGHTGVVQISANGIR
jgi:hypothetical protein